MKKLLMVMTVVGFVACNNSSDSTATPSADSAVKAVTATADSAKAAIDTAVKKVDSTAKAVTDSLKK